MEIIFRFLLECFKFVAECVIEAIVDYVLDQLKEHYSITKQRP